MLAKIGFQMRGEVLLRKNLSPVDENDEAIHRHVAEGSLEE